MLARAVKRPSIVALLTFLAGFAVSVFINYRPRPANADEAPAAKSEAPATGDRFFEMRTYIANDGKFEDLHKRFRDHTNRLFQKHGMTLIGYWTPVADAKGEISNEAQRTLVYILAYPSREAASNRGRASWATPNGKPPTRSRTRTARWWAK